MNRLVIVGNGFDLAHGLPTGYCDFIDWFWTNLRAKYKEPEYQDLLEINDMHSGFLSNFGIINSYEDLKKCLKSHASEYGHRYIFPHTSKTKQDENIFKFKSNFFEKICDSYSEKKWVDIENEYYQLLKACLAGKYEGEVTTLNREFEAVKALFKQYLEVHIENSTEKGMKKYQYPIKGIKDKILNLFEHHHMEDLSIEEDSVGVVNNKFLKQFPKSVHDHLIKINNSLNPKHKSYNTISLPFTLLLNFNYTSLTRSYRNTMNDEELFGRVYENQIHGSLENPQTSNNDENYNLIFGFGDEMDEDYKAIEKKNENEYLRNIKSFGYFQTSNYRNLLDSLEAGVFQVWIMGHSCGLSDRILLNKVFEHQNCCSIKVFYHKNEKKGTDNYNDIVQNISRHFNKKEIMRERVVPKNLCMFLPQVDKS